MKNKSFKIVLIIFSILLALVSAYFLIRSILTVRELVAHKEILADYAFSVKKGFAQIGLSLSVICCALTIITYILLKNKLKPKNKLGWILIKCEIPVAFFVIAFDITIYVLYAFVNVNYTFYIITTVIYIMFYLYPALFFIMNTLGALCCTKIAENP